MLHRRESITSLFLDIRRKLHREHMTQLDLQSFLIMPVQRFPRYELLLREVLKHTPADHVDRDSLQKAGSGFWCRVF